MKSRPDVQMNQPQNFMNVLNASTSLEFEKYKNIVTVSFMIFRTGSVLIVGMCDDEILYCIYEY